MSSKSRYQQMFASTLFKEAPKNIKDNIQENINWARKTLKKDDKITWFLRIFKYRMLKSAMNVSSDGANEAIFPDFENGKRQTTLMPVSDSKWIKKFENEHDASASDILENLMTERAMEDLSLRLEHFMDLRIHSVKNHAFDSQSPSQILDELGDLEQEWMDKTANRSLEEYGEVVMETKDGYTWFDLQTPGCKREGDAMHHCGNGYGRPGQNVYSLRSRDPLRDNHWIPHVTLIMNDVSKGHTGEIKGYGNEKPDEKYWPSIVEFLKTDLVNKMDGGGYKPQNNFMLSDLSTEEIKEISEVKPSLVSFYDHWLFNGKEVNERVINGLSEAIGLSEEDKERNAIEIFSGDDLEDFADTFKLKELGRYVETIKEGYFDVGDVAIDEYECETVLDNLISENHEIIGIVQAYLERNYAEILEDEGIDISSGSGILKAGIFIEDYESDSTIQEALLRASESSAESGAYSELYDAVKATMDAVNTTLECNGLSYEHINDKWKFELSPQDLLKRYHAINEEYGKNYSDEDIIDCVKEEIRDNESFSDLDVPYYGFSGEDRESLKERLLEVLFENLDDFQKELEAEKSQEIVLKSPFTTEQNRESAEKMFIKKHSKKEPEMEI